MRATKFFVTSIVFLVLVTSTNFVWAQSELKDENRATVFLDVDIDRLRKNELFKDIPLNTIIDDNPVFFPPVDLNSAKRFVFAGQSKDLATLAGFDWQSDLPFSFYMHITFDSPKGTENFIDVLQQLPKIEIDGKTYCRPPADTNVENCLIRVTETEFLFGTDDYVLNGSLDFLTERLQSKMDQLGEDRIVRAGLDCVGGRAFLEEFLESDGLELVPDEVRMLARPILKVDSLVLSVDLEDTNLLDLFGESPDAESASEFHSAVSQLLNMGRISVSMLSTYLETDEQKACFKELTKQLKAELEGTTTKVDVDQPEQFVELISALASKLRKEAQRVKKMNDFRQVALAVHNFESAYQRFPFNVNENSKWSDQLSWRARILPFMEYNNQWEKMDMEQPWDAEANRGMVDQMPDVFGQDGKKTVIAWIKSDVENFRDIIDGSSNTIMLLEVPAGLPWLEVNDLSTLDAIRLVRGLEDGQELLAARYDGSVYRISNRYTPNQLKAMFSPAGAEVIDFDE